MIQYTLLREKRQEKNIELGNLVADRTIEVHFYESIIYIKKKNYCACEIGRNCGSPSSRTSADAHT